MIPNDGGVDETARDGFRDECGVFGIYGHDDAARLAYLGLYQLQHRGQESCGIVASDGMLRSERAMGLVSEVFDEERLNRLPGTAAIGHTRYSTAGEVSVREAQPFLIACKHGQVAICHNGNLPFATEERKRLERDGAIFNSTSDTEIVLHRIARSLADSVEEAIPEVLRETEGAFSMLFLTPEALIAVRDPRGFRPLALGRLDGAWVVASETCAFDLIGAEYVRDVEPGEMLVITREGMRSTFPLPERPRSFCVFEHVYFSRPDSIIYGRSVNESRHKMGKRLAVEQPADADLVVPVPDSGVAAAIGYAAESRINFRFGLVRNHYIGRTFIEPRQSIRSFGVRLKLNPVRDLIRGRSVVLIDDSIVRGTTSKKIVRLVREAGARAVHVRISCPPTVSPCYYGVDTPNKSELIAAQMSIEEVRRFIEADSLGYLSMEGMLEACGLPQETSCVACWTGHYPTRINTAAETQYAREHEPVPSDSPGLYQRPGSFRGAPDSTAIPYLESNAEERMSNAEIRRRYLERVAVIPGMNEEWIKQGISAHDRAKLAWLIRHEARLEARASMTDVAEIELLRARDIAKYGNPDGPTFELLVERLKDAELEGDEIYEAIIGHSYRTDRELNKKLGL